MTVNENEDDLKCSVVRMDGYEDTNFNDKIYTHMSSDSFVGDEPELQTPAYGEESPEDESPTKIRKTLATDR
jgi:hypothetical protein